MNNSPTLTRYLFWPCAIALVALIVLFYLTHSWTLVYVAVVLSVLEISLSFDNAIVNARVLKQMSLGWRRLFIWIGIPIAVFMVRFLFPIWLINLTTAMSFHEVVNLAIHHPSIYSALLHSSYPFISAFGAAFLLMVFFRFFLRADRRVSWIGWLENNKLVNGLAKNYWFSPLLTCVFGLIWLSFMSGNFHRLIIAYLAGVLLHLLLDGFTFVTERHQQAGSMMRWGIIGFLYLEVLDAAFSLDGVVGAFAVSTDILVIVIGLGIGALFVRTFTLYFVAKQTLNRWTYLEHGAFYAIGSLAILMLLKNFWEIPEWLTGSVGILWILAAWISSIA